jgi:hypothetical protein
MYINTNLNQVKEGKHMLNLDIYDKCRNVPQNAQKAITGGRLSGKTDINPMWRIKALTEQFGPCGIGWKYVIEKQWLENGGNNEIAAFVNINLYIKYNGEWSDGIPGTGGNMFVAKEKNGPYTSDECFKMALTDALSVACKALGVGADIYWDKDKTKYTGKPDETKDPTKVKKISEEQAKRLFGIAKGNAYIVKDVINKYSYNSTKDISLHDYVAISLEIEATINKGA